MGFADKGERLSIFDNIANVYTARNKFDSSYYFFQRGFDEIAPGINENDLAEHVEKYVSANIADYVITLVLDKASALLRQYSFEKDPKDFTQGIKYL